MPFFCRQAVGGRKLHHRFDRRYKDVLVLQKLSNISSKHLAAYVLWMQKKELSASTIKTDLAAIRYFHNKISDLSCIEYKKHRNCRKYVL